MLNFQKEGHIYTDDNGNSDWTSMTRVIEAYHESFEDTKEYWLWYKAIQYLTLNYTDKIKKYDVDLHAKVIDYCTTVVGASYLFEQSVTYKLLSSTISRKTFEFAPLDSSIRHIISYVATMIDDMWAQKNKFSQVSGTEFHEERESHQEVEFYGKNYTLKDWEWKNGKFNFEPGNIYNEVRLCSPKHKICGTADRLHIHENNVLSIVDHKTNIEIKTKSYNNKKMFYPLNELPDTEYHKYSVQLSGYAYMLEELGYKIDIIEFHHYIRKADNTFEPIPKVYDVKYDRELINTLFDHHLLMHGTKF